MIATAFRRDVLGPRLWLGGWVFACAEIASGSALRTGLLDPFHWLFTFWLYVAHFFLLSTVAVRSSRTSLPALYLFGVLFGLYEAWITKVVWAGYGGDGRYAMGHLGAFGYAESAMPLLFHPVMSFLVPLALACHAWPSFGARFPDLSRLVANRRRRRAIAAALVIGLAPFMALNGGPTPWLFRNLVIAAVVGTALSALARPALRTVGGGESLLLGRVGLAVAGVVLVALYALSYRGLRGTGLPSVGVQAATLAAEALVILAIVRLRSARPPPASAEMDASPNPDARRGFRLATIALGALALLLSLPPLRPLLSVLVGINAVLWPPLGLVLTLWTMAHAFRGTRGEG